MPTFQFSATDRMGNTVEGTVSADDMSRAAEEVRQMGYTPIRVQMATASEPTVALPTELTQPIPAPSNAPRPLVPLTGETEEAAESTNWVEPWQRGGAVPQPPPPQATLNMAGTAVIPNQSQTPTQIISPQPPSVYSPAAPSSSPIREGRSGVRIPYGAGNEPAKSVWQRFKETMIFPVYAGVVIKDLAPFYRQFATLINAGLPLYQSLIALEGNTNNAKLKEVARAAQAQVQAGGKFSDVMQAYRWIFSPMQIELVRAAEKGGLLDQVLIRIAEYIEHELEIRRLVSRETLYPKLTLFMALMILGRPGFAGDLPAVASLVLGGMGKGEYTSTNYFMDTLGFGLMILIPFLIAVVIFRLFLFNIPAVRESYDSIKMSIPVLGNLVKQFALAKFARTFAALYKGGFIMSSALEIAGDACGNAVLQKAAHRAIVRAERGEMVSDSLAAAGIFPPMAINMFRTGETSGNLDTMLEKMADFFESEAKTKSHQAAMVFGVIVFLIVAFLVGKAVIGQYMGYGSRATNIGE
jgi:type II secretory pathway component PulF